MFIILATAASAIEPTGAEVTILDKYCSEIQRDIPMSGQCLPEGPKIVPDMCIVVDVVAGIERLQWHALTCSMLGGKGDVKLEAFSEEKAKEAQKTQKTAPTSPTRTGGSKTGG